MSFETRLLKLVAANEMLYNPKNPDYENNSKKKDLWGSIAKELDTNKTTCKTKWHNLRSIYGKILNRISKRGGMPKYYKKWKYFDDMAFIYNYLGSRIPKRLSFDKYTTKRKKKDASFLYGSFPTDEESADMENSDLKTLANEDTFQHIPLLIEDIHIIKKEELETSQSLPESSSFACTVLPEPAAHVQKTNMEDLSEPTKSAQGGPCSAYLAMLGAKIDELQLPLCTRFKFEKQISDIVYEFLAKQCTEC